MSRSNYIVIIISICLVLVVWYYTEKKVAEKKGEINVDMFSFGSLNFSTTGTTNILHGCSDSDALNYNSDVTHDDGSCFYVLGCCDVNATNYDPMADTCDFEDNNANTCTYGSSIPNNSGLSTGNTSVSKTPCLQQFGSTCSMSMINIASTLTDPKCCSCIEPKRDYNNYTY